MIYQTLILKNSGYKFLFDIGNFKKHWHSEIEILFCTGGTFKIKIRDTSYTVTGGQAVFIGSLDEHEIYDCPQDTKSILIEIGAAFLGDAFQKTASLRFVPPVVPVSGTPFEPVFRELSGFRDKDVDLPGRMMIKSCLYRLAALMLQCPAATESNIKKYVQRAKSLNNIHLAIDYIASNYFKEISLKDVAALTGYETSNFCNHFKKATSMTFHEYLINYRIGMACILLNEEHRSVAEVGEKVGIPCPKSFSRIFRKVIGKTPSEYRHNISDRSSNLSIR